MRAWRFLSVPSIMPIILTGCATPSAYAPPSTALPESFVGSPAIDARAPVDPSVDMVRWWDAFGDPLLTQFVEQAIAQNLDLQAAQARVMQARATLRLAMAILLPSGQVSGQAARSTQSLESPMGRLASAFPGYERTADSYELGVGASWELDMFGGRNAARDAAMAEWEASQAAAMAARLAIIAQTADTYIQIRAVQQRLAIAREQEKSRARFTQLIELRFQRGIAAELQVRQSEGALQQVRASIPALQNELEVAMNALDVLLGEPPGRTRAALAAVRPIPLPPAVTSAGGPAALLRRRPDIIAAERRLAASHDRVGVAMSEYYPKFSVSGLFGALAGSPDALVGNSAVQASGLLGLRWRLFDFGRIDADIKAAKGRHAEALALYRQTVLRATQDVEDAFSTLVQQEARADALSAGVTSLSRAQKSSAAAYQAGMVSLVEVLDADRRLLEARDGLVQARATSSRAAIACFRALGGGWQADDAPFSEAHVKRAGR